MAFGTYKKYCLGVLLLFTLLPLGGLAQNQGGHLGNMMHSFYLGVKDKGSFDSVRKSFVKGDIYTHTYAQTELEIVKPARDALHFVYQEIADQCDGDLALQDVAVLFAAIDAGEDMLDFFRSRDLMDKDVSENAVKSHFAKSCLKVLSCELKPLLEKTNKKLGGYSFTIHDACLGVVAKKYHTFQTVTKSLETLTTLNHDDDVFLNGDEKDSPYDLLVDVKAIAKILFAHADPPTQTHFYNMKPLKDFVSNDPHEVTPYVVEHPQRNQNNVFRRFPASYGISPDSPESFYTDEKKSFTPKPFVPQASPPKDMISYIPPPHTNSDSPDTLGLTNPPPATQTLQNALCADEDLPNLSQDNPLDLAQQEQQETVSYNKKLNIVQKGSVHQGGKGPEEWEEQFGYDDIPDDTSPIVTPHDAVGKVFSEESIKHPRLKKVQEQLRACVHTFTDTSGGTGSLDAETIKKLIWKTLSQPTALTQCVLDTLCREVGDRSGRGLYHIKGCTMPARQYDVVGNQPVESIEEIFDEFLNVALYLQNIDTNEYNKTKDARDHQMMRRDLGKKFSFTLSVGFFPLFNTPDPAHVKRMRRENNRYLQGLLLGMNDVLSFEKERNKYVQLYKKYNFEINSEEQAHARQKVESQAQDVREAVEKRAQRSQKGHYAEFLGVYNDFVEKNTDMRVALNGFTNSLKNEWIAEKKEGER